MTHHSGPPVGRASVQQAVRQLRSFEHASQQPSPTLDEDDDAPGMDVDGLIVQRLLELQRRIADQSSEQGREAGRPGRRLLWRRIGSLGVVAVLASAAILVGMRSLDDSTLGRSDEIVQSGSRALM